GKALLAPGVEDAVGLVEDGFGDFAGCVHLEVHAETRQAFYIERHSLPGNQLVHRLAWHSEAQNVANDGKRDGLVGEQVIAGKFLQNIFRDFLWRASENNVFAERRFERSGDAVYVTLLVHFTL